jgi:hypothetical protein
VVSGGYERMLSIKYYFSDGLDDDEVDDVV